MNRHEFFMRKALRLAEEGRGRTNPNPMVGAVLVKNNKIVAAGYHRRVGALHAEAVALRKAGRKAKGVVLYVNLEPCSHTGRTPPCADAIIKSGVKKVYYSMNDPNPLNNGRGAAILKRNGISVSAGLLKDEAERLNEVFIKYITKKMPFVTLKIAESLDGKIATRDRDSKWISSEISREYVHRLRSEVDAILVGITTILKDNPALNSRRPRSPVKVVIDPHFRIPENARIFSRESPALNIVAVLKGCMAQKNLIEKFKRLSKRGILIISCGGKKGRMDLRCLLEELAELEIAHLLVEGGGETAAAFIENGMVDKILFFIAPKIIGGKDAITAIEGKGVDRVKKSILVKDFRVEPSGGDILVEGYLK